MIFLEYIGEPDQGESPVQRHSRHRGERATPRPSDRGHGRGLARCSCHQQIAHRANNSLVTHYVLLLVLS